MVKKPVPLKFAIDEFAHTKAILSGKIPIEGVEPEFVRVVPQIAAYRRMVRNVEFDVCVLAPTTYIIARAYGGPFTALPIFVSRYFHHAGLAVRPDAGIKVPKDLEGKKVGVRAYSVTTGVWTRGILIDEYGLDNSKVTWIVDDEEHVTQMKMPPNVMHAPAGTSLVEMMRKGEISAGFTGPAGLGRSGAPGANWEANKIANETYPELFPNARELEAAWHKKTGIYPFHGTVVVKDSVLKEHPWVARSIFNAYSQAKAEWLKEFKAGTAQADTDKKYRTILSVVGDDPLPYGLAQNLPSIKALESYAFKQSLTPRRMSIEELFVDPEK